MPAKTFKLTNERAKELRATAQQVLDQTGDWLVAAEDLVDFFDSVAETTEAPERVIFRVFPHDGAVIALFPDQHNERNGNIGSYMELGQHAETVPDFGDTVAAEPHEFQPLYNELVRQGYHNLRVVKRFGKLGK
jgi:hypothetical protein